jgi:hypothetical protein
LLYTYTSAAATNGSAFAGLSANTPFYNLTLALAMLCGRFLVYRRVVRCEKKVPVSAGTFPTDVMQIRLFLNIAPSVVNAAARIRNHICSNVIHGQQFYRQTLLRKSVNDDELCDPIV